MTVAICTNCGELKQGALCACPKCEAGPFDDDVSILLSDHNLTQEELRRIGEVIKKIQSMGLDEETRFHAILYFLSRKWPKLLEYDIDAIDPDLQATLDGVYRSSLADVPGQEDPNLKVSPVARGAWTTATGSEFQAEEDRWQSALRGVLADGIDVGTRVVSLKIQAGEGAVLQKVTHQLRSLTHPCDYRRLASSAVEVIGDAKEYRRRVRSFCSQVKNGWSDRTKEQAAYFRGLCQHLVEMAEHTKTIIEHKAGIHILIEMDLKRVRQEFDQSYRTLIDLFQVVMDPSRINPDGTCRPA